MAENPSDEVKSPSAVEAARERARRDFQYRLDELLASRDHGRMTEANEYERNLVDDHGALAARLEAAENVIATARRFLDLDYGYLTEPTREGLEPLVAALSAWDAGSKP